MKHIKAWTGEFFLFFKDNPIILALYIIAMPLLTLAWIQSFVVYAKRALVPICFVDYFIITKDGFFIYMVVVLMSILLCAFLNKNDFNINRIIRQKDVRKIWIKQTYFSILVSFSVSAYQLIIVSIIGILNYTVLINFNQKQSLFGLFNDGSTTNKVVIPMVVIASFVFCFLAVALMNIIYQLLKWVSNHDFICLIALILIGFLDSYGGVGIINLAGVSYGKWLPYRPITLLIPILVIVAVYVIGLKYSEHKEFLNAKS
ncbi:MAG: hypothetical protein PHV07_08035 [Oscillospiraceae bacterium]|nr:hypothetical protein [Oscillospiraceae bacterium]